MGDEDRSRRNKGDSDNDFGVICFRISFSPAVVSVIDEDACDLSSMLYGFEEDGCRGDVAGGSVGDSSVPERNISSDLVVLAVIFSESVGIS